jgi:hypothetical protein
MCQVDHKDKTENKRSLKRTFDDICSTFKTGYSGCFKYFYPYENDPPGSNLN